MTSSSSSSYTHAVGISRSQVDLSALPIQLSPPSSQQLRDYVLCHPLLSTRLPSSASLEAEIQALRGKINEDLVKLQEARQTVLEELNATSNKLAEIRRSLDVIPAEIEELGDAIDAISQSLTQESGGQTSVSSTLEKYQEAIVSFRSARDYFAILGKAQQLWEAALVTTPVPSSSTSTTTAGDAQLDSLAELSNLYAFAVSLSHSSSPEKGTGLRFLPFLHAKLQETSATLLKRRTTTLRDALSRAGWPPLSPEQAEAQGKVVRSSESVLDNAEVRSAWTALTSLQIVGALLHITPAPSCLQADESTSSSSASAPSPGEQPYIPLLTTSLLVEPYLLRFRYHFDSSQSTNRLDKPEWYLDHMLALIRSLLPLFSTFTKRGSAVKLSAPALRRYGKHSAHPESDLIHVLLTPLKRKVEASIPLLLSQGASTAILTHTISALTSFDADLQDTLHAFGSTCPRSVRIAEVVLSKEEWFSAWVKGEKYSAEAALESFLEDGNSWTISTSDAMADDHAASGQGRLAGASSKEAKSTASSRSLVLLLQSLTNTYTPLPLLSHRLQFLTLVQLPLLRSYAQRLTRSLEAFESLSSAFARAIPGGIEATSSGALVNTESDMVRGLRGLDRLLKAYLSALHVKEEVEKWKMTSFFLDMSEEVLGSETGMKLLQGGREEAEWSELDGESLGGLIRKGWRGGSEQPGKGVRPSTPSESRPASLSVWDEVIDKYQEILNRSSVGMKKLVTSEVIEGLKGYAQMYWLDTTSPMDNQSDDAISIPTPLLLPAMTTLHTHLSHLLNNLPASRCIPVYRSIASDLSAQIVQRVVITGGSKRFSLAGAQRFLLDYEEGWISVLSQLQRQVTSSTAPGTSLRVEMTGLGYNPASPWSQLRDVAILLSLPTVAVGPLGEGSGIDGGGAGDATSSRWGDWTLPRAMSVLFDEDALRGRVGEEKMRRELKLASWDLVGRDRIREVLRRRVDCGR